MVPNDGRQPETSEIRPQLLPKIGRYTILGVLGRGGMGLVYKGYDGDLDRRVAIKVFHRERTIDDSQARALREAQALAKLSHPNIVAVHEVGTFERQIFIVMEYVQGSTLRELLRSQPPYTQIIDVFVQIGRALAAAHAAGIIHRDLKPENVVVAADGHAQVLDFGLARAADGNERESTARNHTLSSRDSAQLSTLTSPGDLVGTPAYMAPEQLLRERACERSDQYAFCVALYEAIYGERPFVAPTIDELRVKVLSGVIRTPAKPPYTVPAYLRSALLRGLSFAREDRFPSMEALVEGILAGERRRTRRRRLAAGLGAVALVGAVAGLLGLVGRSGDVTCDASAEPAEALWADAGQARVKAAMLAGGPGYAAHDFELLRGEIDRYTAGLAAVRRKQCDQPEASPDRRAQTRRCLAESDWALAGLIEVLSAPERAHRAAEVAAALPDVDQCLRDARPARPQPEDAEHRAQAVAIRQAFTQTRMALVVGDARGALTLVEQALVVATRAGQDDLAAEGQLLRGLALADLHPPSRAEAALHEAVRQGVEVGAPHVLIDGFAALARLMSEHPNRRDEALRAGELALAAARHEGFAEQRRLAHALRTLAAVYAAYGEQAPAERRARDALELLEAALPREHPDVLECLGELARIVARRDPGEAAESLAIRVLVGHRSIHGPGHPATATALHELAEIERVRGEHDLAASLHADALAIREAALGGSHPDVARSIAALGAVARDRGELAEAEQLLRRSLAMSERSLAPWHPQVAGVLEELAAVSAQLGRPDEARALRARAAANQQREAAAD